MEAQNESIPPRQNGKKDTTSKHDEFIQLTNSSSIVSKRSVERLYHGNLSHSFLRYFVPKPIRRSPLINRGYWVRMEAIRKASEYDRNGQGRKVIVNLGCGYDPTPFSHLAQGDMPSNVIYVDVDYPELMQKKTSIIAKTEALYEQIPGFTLGPCSDLHPSVYLRSSNYIAIGCNLKQIDLLKSALQSLALLTNETVMTFVAEVSIAYMDVHDADAIISWASNLLVQEARFVLLEQIMPAGPSHPFVQTMLGHFKKIGTPLRCVLAYPQLQDQIKRFKKRGWDQVDTMDLKYFWDNHISQEVKEKLKDVEPFDEWEEFYLFCQHYFILTASTSSSWQHELRNTQPNFSHHLPYSASMNLYSKHFSPLHRRFSSSSPLGAFLLLVFGGLTSKSRVSAPLLVFDDSDKNETEQVKTLLSISVSKDPEPRMCHTQSTLSDGSVLITGGRSQPSNIFSDCWLFKDGNWHSTAPLLVPRCRHSAVVVNDMEVLVFGGFSPAITNKESKFEEWSLWSEGTWHQVKANKRVGYPIASSTLVGMSDSSGILFGGIDSDGRIISHFWSWKLSKMDANEYSIELTRIESSEPSLLSRFGAQGVALGPHAVLIVGGIQSNRLMVTDDYVVQVDLETGQITRARLVTEESRDLPLLVGFSLVPLENGLGIIGGGAVCFSFGAFWNDFNLISFGGKVDPNQWKIEPLRKQMTTPLNDDVMMQSDRDHVAKDSLIKVEPLPIIPIGSREDLERLFEKRKPALFKNVDIGDCKTKWTSDYLKNKVGSERDVVVHVAKEAQMNFQRKNFEYRTIPFGSFIDHVFPSDLSTDDNMKMYLRSISHDNPKSKPSLLREDFPTISSDFRLPSVMDSIIRDHEFSSPLRISSDHVGMWLHYDVTANVLVQVRGRKKVRLYPPRHAAALGFPAGASSSTIDNIFKDKRANSSSLEAMEGIMEPGDILYIPPVWLHAMEPLEPSISINVFWRDLPDKFYAVGKDVYGNRDLAAYEHGRLQIKRLTDSFSNLPPSIARFYMERLISELGDHLPDV